MRPQEGPIPDLGPLPERNPILDHHAVSNPNAVFQETMFSNIAEFADAHIGLNVGPSPDACATAYFLGFYNGKGMKEGEGIRRAGWARFTGYIAPSFFMQDRTAMSVSMRFSIYCPPVSGGVLSSIHLKKWSTTRDRGSACPWATVSSFWVSMSKRDIGIVRTEYPPLCLHPGVASVVARARHRQRSYPS